jgi:hypothetical protein
MRRFRGSPLLIVVLFGLVGASVGADGGNTCAPMPCPPPASECLHAPPPKVVVEMAPPEVVFKQAPCVVHQAPAAPVCAEKSCFLSRCFHHNCCYSPPPTTYQTAVAAPMMTMAQPTFTSTAFVPAALTAVPTQMVAVAQPAQLSVPLTSFAAAPTMSAGFAAMPAQGFVAAPTPPVSFAAFAQPSQVALAAPTNFVAMPVAAAPSAGLAFVQPSCQSSSSGSTGFSTSDFAATSALLGKLKEALVAQQALQSPNRNDSASFAAAGDVEELGKRVQALQARVEDLTKRVNFHDEALGRIVEKLPK